MPAHLYQYSLTELGLMVTRYLSFKRQDRAIWKPLTQKAAIVKWKELSAAGAHHSCCTVILSTTDPKQLRKKVGFSTVEDYPHLKGALYRKVILEDELLGSIATYIVVLNDLPVCAINAPLLLLSTEDKKIEFCKWLLEEVEGLTLEEKRYYQFYLLENHLIQNEEVEKKMRHDFFGPPDHNWIFDEFEERSPDEQERFRQLFYQRMLHANSPQEVAQKALGASSPQEVAQKALGASSPLEVAQKALHANSPLEAAQKLLHANSTIEVAQQLLQSDEQRRAMMAYLQQLLSTPAPSPSVTTSA